MSPSQSSPDASNSESTGQAPANSLGQAAGRLGMDFGTAVEPWHLDDPDLEPIMRAEFSVIEAENSMKFGPIHPREGAALEAFDFEGPDRLANFARNNGMKLRGHTLVWHQQNPAWLTTGRLTAEQLAKTMEEHIEVVAGRFRDTIYAWDVVNEAFNDDGTMRSTIWYDQPGIGMAGQGTAYLERAFRLARQADPKALLFYNDYDAEMLGAKSDAIYAMCRDFRDRGIPLDGIGFQGHLIMQMNTGEALDSVQANFERFANLGLVIHVTELDIRLSSGTPEAFAEQADFYRKFVELCRRQDAVKLIQMWGISDRDSWIPGWFEGFGWPLLWDSKMKKKPAYFAVLEALRSTLSSAPSSRGRSDAGSTADSA
ncbi:MAG TPA: endo-1,4-beta-xylanase [Fimbriimonadaceae bacterium]|nr:endo-1,4-beta-xylanase [Fimbriimonadaceae bacterium]